VLPAKLTAKGIERAYKGIGSPAQAIEIESVTLAALIRTSTQPQVEALVMDMLIRLNDLLNLKRPLTEAAIEAIADEVVNTHYNLTLADISVIMRRALSGYYGEFYESINMPKVLGWFNQYFDERCEAYEAKHYREKHNYNIRAERSYNNFQDEIQKHKQAAAAYLSGQFNKDLNNIESPLK
jgi:hypothetical protein